MTQLKLIIGASVRDRLRWARQHLYSLLILSPMVIGMTIFSLHHAAGEAPAWRPSLLVGVALAVAVVGSLIGLALSRASVELYHLRRPETVLDSLPVTHATHLHTILAHRLGRAAAVGAVVLLIRTLFTDNPPPLTPSLLVPLALFIALIALAEVLAALNWIHWAHTRDAPTALGAVVLLVPAILLAALLSISVITSSETLARHGIALALAAFVWSALLYGWARWAHRSWRASDIEYAKRLHSADRWRLPDLHGPFEKWFGPVVAAQLTRDLQLTLRVFSSTVYVVAGVGALTVTTLVVVLRSGVLPPAPVRDGWFEATWLAPVMAVKLAALFSTVALAALMPVLIAHQIPHRWLERIAGTTGEEMWEAKLWYVRLVSLPAPLVVWAAGAATGRVPFFYVIPLFAECLWLWWMVSTLFGMLSFEIPDQPGLALILMITVAFGVGFFVALLWPIGLALYAFGLAQLAERGHARAHYHLIEEEE